MTNIKIKKYELKIGSDSALFRDFNDLGDEITKEFRVLYDNFIKGQEIFTDGFVNTSRQLFSDFDSENIVTLSDSYFNNLTFIMGKLFESAQYSVAFSIWTQIIHFVKEWELSSGKKLHKGTPYYFAGTSALLSMDFDAALPLIHLAYIEDKSNNPNYKETPSYYFLTLNEGGVAQYLGRMVTGMVGFLRDRLDGQGNEHGKYKDHYQGTRGGTLTYEQLRQKFLDNDSIRDEVRYLFVYSVLRLWRLRILEKENLGDDVVAPVIFTQVLGIILVVIEFLLKIKFPRTTKFGDYLTELASGRNENWRLPNLGQINHDRDSNFDSWVDNCLNQNALSFDFCLSYGLRNFAFHTVKSQQKLWMEYTRVLQSVWNCFFKTIEIM